MMRKLKNMKDRIEFHDKVNRALLAITTPVVGYMAFEIYSMNCEAKRLKKKVEALKIEA
ncbi:unnamed protein product [Urochloa humidicola]